MLNVMLDVVYHKKNVVPLWWIGLEEDVWINVTMWNTYALDWSENEIIFFINGKIVRKIK